MKIFKLKFQIFMMACFLVFSMTNLQAQGNSKAKFKKHKTEQLEAAEEQLDDGKKEWKKKEAKGKNKVKKAHKDGQEKGKAFEKGKKKEGQKMEQTGKGKVKVTKNKPKGRNVTDVAKMKKGEKGKSNKGKAYGKNKGELKGKEFGQARATAARKKHMAEKAKAKEKVAKGTERMKAAQGKIQNAKVKLEADKKAGKVTQEQYDAKKAKIGKAEEKLRELGQSVTKVKKGLN